jgi:alkylresorcinol/alkylpyrone synthase
VSVPRIVATARAGPEHACSQAKAREEMARLGRGNRIVERLLSVFDHAGVKTRHFVHPPEWYTETRSFEERNGEYLSHGLDLATRAASDCLANAGVPPDEVDHIFFVTTTGLATPSLDARLTVRLGLRADVRRWPLFGLGCAGGAGALIRASDALSAAPRQRALIVSLELCSLVFSPGARTPTDVVGAALFGDGAAAVLMSGDELADGDAGPRILATRSHLFKAAPNLMGWNFTSDGMRLVLSGTVPAFVAESVTPVVERFLSDHGVTRSELTHYVLHPGGPKVMAAYRSALGVTDDELWIARETMEQYGNLSSAAVLFMLHRLQTSGRAQPDEGGLLVALGPGFATEMLVLSW